MDAPAARETILVVDDEIGTRYSIARVLTKEGYVVLEGGTGREALELAPKAALVILDIRLPDLSGIEVNRRLKENAATRFLPVLHLSATFTSPQDRAAGLEGGADAYLVHPFDAGELLATVRALLRASKMRGESHRAARQWRNAFDSITDALAILSLEGDVIRCNRAFQRIAGRSSEEIVGMPLSQSIPELAPHLASAHVDAVEVAVDGSWLRLTLEPLEDDQGRIAGTMCVLNDVTESRRSRDRLEARVEARAAELAEVNRELRAALDQHRKSELDLRERTRALEASNAELERFAYVSSHDLQEPLRMVVAYSQLLAERYKGRLDADADEYIHFAVEGALRMQTLIRDLLAYSRVGANERIRTVDLEEVARRAVANLQAAIDESHATIEIAPLPNVMGDDAQLSQLFQNVLSNAIKFRREAPPAIRICAADSNDPKRVRIGIADNGIGIEMPYRERIFEIFQRLHTREEFPGTGVGLAIAKKTVERHGGRIWVESEPGCGSTFFFTLPRAVERSGERAERTNGRSASDAV